MIGKFGELSYHTKKRLLPVGTKRFCFRDTTLIPVCRTTILQPTGTPFCLTRSYDTAYHSAFPCGTKLQPYGSGVNVNHPLNLRKLSAGGFLSLSESDGL